MASLRGPLSLSHPTKKNREMTTVPSGLGKAKGKIRMEVCWLIAEWTARHGFFHQKTAGIDVRWLVGDFRVALPMRPRIQCLATGACNCYKT